MAMREPHPGSFTPPTSSSAGSSGTASQASSGSGQGTMDGVKDVADKTQEKIGAVADQARDQASSRLDSGKERAVDGLGNIAQAVRQAGHELRQQEQGQVAEYADRAAERIERLAGYLRARDVGQLIDETEGFARRQPVLFLGGASVLGMLAARLMRSSTERVQARRRYEQSLGTPTPGLPGGSAQSFQPSELDRATDHDSWAPTSSSASPAAEALGHDARPRGAWAPDSEV